MFNISSSYIQIGDMQRAMVCIRESLRVLQTALLPGHQHILLAEDMLRYLEQAMQEGDKYENVAQVEDGCAKKCWRFVAAYLQRFMLFRRHDEDVAQEDAREVEEDIEMW